MKTKSLSYNLQPLGANLKSGVATVSYIGDQKTFSTQQLVDDVKNETEEDEKTEHWGSQKEFLLSCIASSVGLGNVWRFPFTAYKNGGGAFLIPYLVVLFLIGKPLYLMELTLGQFTNLGQIEVWRCAPILKGMGIGQAFSTFYLTTYINALMAICIFYFFACFQSILPWTWCDPEWADMTTCKDDLLHDSNETINSNISTTVATLTSTSSSYDNGTQFQSPAEQYNKLYVLHQSDGIDNMGMLDWRLSLCLLASWSFIFITVIRGVQSSGKIAYFTAIFPYAVLITLLGIGCSMDGAVDGILYFITPQWSELLNIRVWYNACEQLFFSLGVGYGYLTVYSSYNPFGHSVYKDAMIVSIVDTFTSILAGLTIFTVLGSLSYHLDTDIKEVVKQGPSLAFIAYPKALAQLDFVPQLWAALFFFMLFTLGVGSAVSHMAGIMSVLQSIFPKLKKWQMALGVCLMCFIFGLFYTNQAGQYILSLVDSYGTGFTTFFWAILETVGLMWVYGLRKFCDDINFMLKFKIGIFWRVCWGFIIPVGLIAIFIYAIVMYEPLSMDNYVFPDWANGIGWFLAAIPLIQFPIWSFYFILKLPGNSFKEKLAKSLVPEASWGPKRRIDRIAWLKSKQPDIDPEHEDIPVQSHTDVLY